MRVDGARGGKKLFVPHLLGNPLACAQLAGALGQRDEQCVFLAAQLDGLSCHEHPRGALVDAQLPGLDARVLSRRLPVELRAAQVGPHSREQLSRGKGLGDVVVGAGVQPAHLVRVAVERGEHDDGHLVACLAQGARHLDARHLGQHHVEQDEVGLCLARACEAVGAVGGAGDGISFPREGKLRGDAYGLVVFDQENVGHLLAHPLAPCLLRPARLRAVFGAFTCSIMHDARRRARAFHNKFAFDVS